MPFVVRRSTSIVVGVRRRREAGRLLEARDVASERHLRSRRRHRRRSRRRPRASRRTRSTLPITASAASSTSVSPGRGRPRSAASASASRVPAIRSSGDAPSPARAEQAGDLDEEPSDAVGAPGWSNTWRYQPGARHAGRVARRRAQAGDASTAPTPRRPSPSGARASSAASLAWRASSRRQCRGQGRARRRRRPTTGPVGILAGGADRPTHVRLALQFSPRRDEAGADGGHRAATASNAAGPSPRCSITSSHQRSGSGSPAAAARSPQRVGRRLLADQLVRRSAPLARRRSVTASGRSIARTGTSCSFAQRSPATPG